ncbi:helix-turn-helix transcriptional regulator, partial [Actinomadura rudentiformis]
APACAGAGNAGRLGERPRFRSSRPRRDQHRRGRSRGVARPGMFHAEGHTVAGWIRERRLEQCRRNLADPRLAARSIHAIAARWGFTSPAHFSQAFRTAYGLSPRQFRHQCSTVHPD